MGPRVISTIKAGDIPSINKQKCGTAFADGNIPIAKCCVKKVAHF